MLKEQGHEVIGLFMRNWHDTTGTLEGDCPWYDDQVFAELVAKRLDIEFHYVDLSEEYRKRVVDYMFAEYEAGRTPNPDVLCNREIKFDVFLKEALKLGAERVATGHYCRRGEYIDNEGNTHYQLLAGSDPNKDQSYFLCQLTQEQLSYAMFPIGDLLKPEVRRIAEEQKLATAKRKDSQGICFVGKVSEQEANRYTHFADCAYLSFQKNKLFDMTLPAKLQSYMACGTPILAAAGGESARVVREAGCGFVCEQEADALATTVRECVLTSGELGEMGARAREYFDGHFSVDLLVGELESIMGAERT